MVRTLPKLLVFAALMWVVGCEQAAETDAAQNVTVLPGTESSKDFGAYVVHFNALATDQLTPDIAREYGIVRSQNRAMLNVSIIQSQPGGIGTPVPGSVSASAINLTGQLKSIPIREIREDTAIYYIGEIAISNAETLIFTLDVTPINEPSRFTVRFQKQFYVD
jgi:hypothetical protein